MSRDRTLGNFEARIDTETQTRRALRAGDTSPRLAETDFIMILISIMITTLLTRINRSMVETETPSPGCSEHEEEEVNRRLPGGSMPGGSSQFPTGETLHTELEEESGHGSVSRKATSPRQSSRQVSSSPRQGSSPGHQGPSPRRGAGARFADQDKDCERQLGESTDHGDHHR